MTSQVHRQICASCIMDESDPDIIFNADGVCNHCEAFKEVASAGWFPGPEGVLQLDAMIAEIKGAGAEQEYDCILGLSGGVDSSYLALKIKDFGLRPLVFHVDAGWNSELAVNNIQRIVDYCGYDLFTFVVNWEDMRNLQLSYLKAGVSNQDVPQDHIFFSTLYHYATKHNIKYILSGGNLATEGVFPSSWQHSAMDAWNLHAIHRKFGRHRLEEYKTISPLQYYFYYPLVKGMRTVRPLNFMEYNKKAALRELVEDVGFKEYGRKHGESRFTRLIQNHYYPVYIGHDIRRPHLSSLVVSGQMTRDEALEAMEEPLYDPVELERDLNYLAKKLGISRDELNEILQRPKHRHSDFHTWNRFQAFVKLAQQGIARLTGRSLKRYS